MGHRRKSLYHSFISRTEVIDTLKRAVWPSLRIGVQLDAAATGIARKESDVKTLGDRVLQVLIHFRGVVFVMPYRQKAFGTPQSASGSVGIQIGNVGHVVTVLLQPKGQRKFPQEPFARTSGEGGIQN